MSVPWFPCLSSRNDSDAAEIQNEWSKKKPDVSSHCLILPEAISCEILPEVTEEKKFTSIWLSSKIPAVQISASLYPISTAGLPCHLVLHPRDLDEQPFTKIHILQSIALSNPWLQALDSSPQQQYMPPSKGQGQDTVTESWGQCEWGTGGKVWLWKHQRDKQQGRGSQNGCS